MSNKRKRFEAKKNDNKIYIIAGLVIILIIAAAAIKGFGGKDSGQAAVVPTGTNQGGQQASMVREVSVTPTVTADKIIIKKSDLEKNKILKFDYEPVKLTLKTGKQVSFPLLAYVTPSGRLVTAVRMCEPCNGLTFSIANGNILNCNTCGTQWDLETTKWNGVGAQSCGSYEPEAIPNTVNGDNIEINFSDFKDWLPRI